MSLSGAKMLGFLFTAIGIPMSTLSTNIDLDTTLPLSTDTFWRLAQSEDIYRNSRVQDKYVRQRVVELGKWATKYGSYRPKNECNASVEKSYAPSIPFAGHLQREAHLVSSIVCPLGSADTQVLQDHTLAVQDGTITYMSVDCVKGMPAVGGDFVVKTTVQVTSEADNPGTVRVRVAINVGDLKLPVMLQWLQGRISKSVRADGVKQANRWLSKMVESEGTKDKKMSDFGNYFQRFVGRLEGRRQEGM